MTDPRYGPSPHIPGERWNVNMPAIIGVVFVGFVGVVIWVLATRSDNATTADASSTTVALVTDLSSPVTVPLATTVQPMPSSTTSTSTIAAVITTPPTVPVETAPITPIETVPITAAPNAEPGAVLGDLGVPARPMQQPGCDGGYIAVLASAIGDQATAAGIADALDSYPGSNYLRTDQTCPSLTQAIDGQPIYVVYLGPFALDSDACAARGEGPDGAYARRLSNDLGPEHAVPCTN